VQLQKALAELAVEGLVFAEPLLGTGRLPKVDHSHGVGVHLLR
jgi:hypothetical protein